MRVLRHMSDISSQQCAEMISHYPIHFSESQLDEIPLQCHIESQGHLASFYSFESFQTSLKSKLKHPVIVTCCYIYSPCIIPVNYNTKLKPSYTKAS